MKREKGHFLLKRLGKTKLRPGGVEATNWLLEQVDIDENTKILEVACNEADNLINISRKYGNKCMGLDKSEEWISNGRAKVQAAGLEDRIELIVGDALNLPFEDESFDIVINEAMLTMMDDGDKERALEEYRRVLKKGGILLTHDVRLIEEDQAKLAKLRKALNMKVSPLTLEAWMELFEKLGFKELAYKSGEPTLFSESGLIADEGKDGMKKIMENLKDDPNRGQFMEMRELLLGPDSNNYYIAIKSVK